MRNLLLGIVAAAFAFSQTPAPPSAGLPTLAGRVTTSSGPDVRPLRRARVTLTGGRLSAPRVTDTDTKGVYRFDRLAAGDYRIAVQKPGFVKLDTAAAPDAVLNLVRAGAIEGIVADAGGEPMENVLVSAIAARDAASVSPLAAVAQTRTDDLGRYRLHSLPPGDYIVGAATDALQVSRLVLPPGERPGDFTRAYYPAAASAGDAKAMHVTPGLEVRDIDITLAPVPGVGNPAPATTPPASPAGTGRIAGKITAADSGKPIKNAVVTVVGYGITNARNSFGTVTGADGRFEVTGLTPARYQVNARASRYLPLGFGQKRPSQGLPTDLRNIDLQADQTFGAADIALPRPGAIEGTVLDEFGDPQPGVIVQPAQPEFVAGRTRLLPMGGQTPATDDNGHFRLRNLAPSSYYIAALSGVFGDGTAGGFSATYYPGTVDPSAAQPVHLEFASDTRNVVLALQPARTANVSGRAIDDTGQPVGRQGLVLLELNGGDLLSFIGARGSTAVDGTFRFSAVPVGSYVLQALAGPPTRAFGSTQIRVDDADVTDAIVKVSKGAVARGRIIFDGNAPQPKPDGIRFSARPVEFVTSPAIGFGPPPSQVNADWTFEISGVSGLAALTAIVPSPWSIKSIAVDGRDFTDTPLDFRKGNVENLEVTLTSRTTLVTGSVSDERGAPMTDYAVVLFSADRARWAFPSRFIALARPAQSGGFRTAALPPDDYLAAAIPTVNGFEWQDPVLLERLRAIATAFTLTEGESRTLELKLKKRP
jgi:hypothetical protein